MEYGIRQSRPPIAGAFKRPIDMEGLCLFSGGFSVANNANHKLLNFSVFRLVIQVIANYCMISSRFFP
jgi:hypothetical protein